MFLIITLILQLFLVAMSLYMLRITSYNLIWIITASASSVMVLRDILLFIYKGDIPACTICDSIVTIAPALVSLLLVIVFVIFYHMYKSRSKLESTLRQNEKDAKNNFLTLSAAVEQSPSIVIITDLEGDIEYVNPKFTELTGYEEEEVIGSTPRILKSGHFQDNIYKEMWNTISSGGEWRGEFHNQKKNGDLYWEAASISSIKDINGNIQHYLAVKEDITEKKIIEEALSRSEKRLKDVQKAAHIGTWEWDSENKKAFWSDENYRILGMEPGKIEPSLDIFRSFIHPEDRGKVFKAADNLHDKRKENNEIFRIILQDGTEKYVNDWSYYSYNTDGELIYSTGMMQDITEQKKVEEALKKSEERLLNAQKIAHIGTWEWSSFSNRVFWSDEDFRIMGMEPGEVEPSIDRFIDLIHPDDREEVIRKGNEARENHTNYNDEFRLLCKDDSIKYVHNWGTNYYNKANEHLYTTGMMQDITNKVESEKKLKSSLEEKNALLRELYHRTKNNMQVISAMLNLSSSKLDNIKVSEVFTDLDNRIQSMSLVHEKLYQSQNLSSINLKEYIMDLCSSIEISYNKTNCKVSFIYSLEGISVLIDVAVPLGLIINELISNAFKHAFPGRKTGNVHISLKLSYNSIIKLEITDNGIGLGSDFSLDNLETLGLQTVYALGHDQLHGNIELDTSSGFKFSLEFKNDAFKPRV